MPRATLEVADIFRTHGPAYRAAHPLPLTQLSVMRAIEVCRTATLRDRITFGGPSIRLRLHIPLRKS